MAQRREIVVQIPPDDYRRLKRLASCQERGIEQQAAVLLRKCLSRDAGVPEEAAGAGAAV